MRRPPGPWDDALRRLHARGLSDSRVADLLSEKYPAQRAWTRRQVEYRRRRFRLPGRKGFAPSEFRSLAELRRASARSHQAWAGWGHLAEHALRRREADLLSALDDAGRPLTRRQLAAALGVPAARLRSGAGSYLGRLVAAGLVAAERRGPRPALYRLAAGVARHRPGLVPTSVDRALVIHKSSPPKNNFRK
jgi:hypothetical protein